MGVWSLFFTVTTILETSKAGLVKNAVIKFLNSEEQSEHKKIRTASLIINILFTLFVGGIILLFSDTLSIFWDVPPLATLLRYYLLSLIALVPFSHFEYIQQAYLSFSGILTSYLVRQGIFFVAVISLSLRFDGYTLLYYLVFLQALSISIGSAIGYFYSKKFISQHLSYSKFWIIKLIEYGRYVLATNISSLVFRSTDQIMVASFVSASAVALYNVCIRITNLLDIPSTVAAEVLFPKSVKLINQDSSSGKYLYEKSVGIILALLIPASIFIFIFPEYILYVIAGPEYEEASSILQITVLYGLFLPFLKQFGTMMDATGHPNVNFRVILILAVINIIANYLFIQEFGLLGAAYGTLLTYLIGYTISQFVLSNRLGVSPIRVVSEIMYSYKNIYDLLRSRTVK